MEAARAQGDGVCARVAIAGTAGHVLDFDDTYAQGLAHLSAPVAPAALVLGAARGAGEEDVLAAYAAGFEAMGALARASHPALYERGWHPTAVCGPLGAAVAAGSLLGLEGERLEVARALSLLAGAGLQAAFGSDGKALQVGSAAAAGVRAALAAEAGARAPLAPVASAFERAYGGRWAEPEAGERAIDRNWLKPWPCCLQTHSAIEAAAGLALAEGEGVSVRVHPISLRAAHVGIPADGLEAKFSIPYTVAHSLLHGPPGVEAFRRLDGEVLAIARAIDVTPDPSLPESAAVVRCGDAEARVEAALGSPERPLSPEAAAAKRQALGAPAGDPLALPPALGG